MDKNYQRPRRPPQKPLDLQIQDVEKHTSQLKESIQKIITQNQKMQEELVEVKNQQKELFDRIQKEKDQEKQLRGDPNASIRKAVEELAGQEEELMKRIQQLKSILQSNSYIDRVNELTNQIQQLEQQKVQLEKETTKLQASMTEVTKILEEQEEQSGYKFKIDKLEGDAKRLRDKLKQIKTEEQMNERKQRRQNQFLVMLEEDYRVICEEKGISTSINLTRAQELEAIEIKHEKPKVAPKNYPEATEDNIEKVQMEIIEVKKAFYEEGKRLKNEIESHKRLLQQKEGEVAQMMLRIRDRDQEAYVNEVRINEISRILKAQKPSIEPQLAMRRNFKDTRKEIHGVNINEPIAHFDDSERLSSPCPRILGLVVWFDKHVYALQTLYEVDGEEKKLDAFSDMKCNDTHRYELILQRNEFISSISIGVSLSVEYIWIKSNRDVMFVVGKSNTKQRNIVFDIQKNETIAAFCGAFGNIKINPTTTVQALIAFGVTLRKKDPALGHYIPKAKSRLDNHLKQNSFYQI